MTTPYPELYPPEYGAAARPRISFAPALLELARIWPTYTDDNPVPVLQLRCGEPDCERQIFPPDLQGRVQHLITGHGFRMDGRAFDNHNRLVTTAAKELTARAGR